MASNDIIASATRELCILKTKLDHLEREWDRLDNDNRLVDRELVGKELEEGYAKQKELQALLDNFPPNT